MSFAVTSSMTWWVLRPLIAANIPPLRGTPAPPAPARGRRSWVPGCDAVRSSHLDDVGRRDARLAADGEGDLAFVAERDALDDALGGRLVVLHVGDRGPDEVERLPDRARRLVPLHGLVQVRDLFERREGRHLGDEVLVPERVHRVLVLELADEQLQEVVLAEAAGLAGLLLLAGGVRGGAESLDH